jgi:hypothetical protein
MFKNIKYISLSTTDLSTLSVNAIVNKFYSEALESASSSDTFAVQMQAKVNGNLRSIGKIQVWPTNLLRVRSRLVVNIGRYPGTFRVPEYLNNIVTQNEKDALKSFFTHNIHGLYSHYSEMVVSDLFIRYSHLDANDIKAKVTLSNVIENNSAGLNTPDLPNLPQSVNLKDWGTLDHLDSTNTSINGYIENNFYSLSTTKALDEASGIFSYPAFRRRQGTTKQQELYSKVLKIFYPIQHKITSFEHLITVM